MKLVRALKSTFQRPNLTKKKIDALGFQCDLKFCRKKNMSGRRCFFNMFFSRNSKIFEVVRSSPYFQGSSVSPRQAQGHLNRAKISSRSKVMSKLLSYRVFFFGRFLEKNMLRSWNSKMAITFERFEIFGRFRCPCACLGETELPWKYGPDRRTLKKKNSVKPCRKKT